MFPAASRRTSSVGSVFIWFHYARRNDSTSSRVHDKYLHILFDARDGTQVIILLISIVSCRNDSVWIKYPEPANHLVHKLSSRSHRVLCWKYTNYYARNDLVCTNDLISSRHIKVFYTHVVIWFRLHVILSLNLTREMIVFTAPTSSFTQRILLFTQDTKLNCLHTL